MIVILVGPDEIGKTTLAKLMAGYGFEIRKLENADKRHRHERRWWALRECAQWGALNIAGRDIVYDRFPYPDELIYGDLNDPHFWPGLWEPRLRGHHVVFVLMVPQTGDEEYTKRAGDQYSFLQRQVIPRYDEFALSTEVPLLIHTGDLPPTSSTAYELIARIRNVTETVWGPPPIGEIATS